MRRLLVFAFLISVLTACDDDNDPGKKPTDPEIVPVAVNYVVSGDEISEQSELHTVTILLSEAAQADGNLEIVLSGDIETGYFTTDPAVSGGKIMLAVSEGDAEVSFEVLPVNNTKLNGNRTVSFLIASASGSVSLGESIEYLLTLTDDELTSKPKTSTRVVSAFSQVKNTYEYNEDGLVSKLHWESKSPFGLTSGTEEYFYNEAGEIQKIGRMGTGLERLFTWEEGVIVKFEQVINGEVTTYNVYEYDEANRVKNIDTFIRNVGGHFVSDSYTTYSYHEDGNLHEITLYSFDENEDAFVVNTITTYEDYVEGHNPLPDVEPLPNQPVQTKLPTYYSREAGGVKHEYSVSYEFTVDGRLTKKNVTGAAPDTGVTTYTYFD